MEHIISENPSTCEKLKIYAADSQKQIEEKIKLSKNAFEVWKGYPIKKRVAYVAKLRMHLKAHKNELAHLITTEIGKPIKQSFAEIEKCIWLCEHAIANARAWLSDEKVETDAKESYIKFEPLGLIAAIMPWNFPFWQVFRAAIPALVAGNTIILKHSSNCPTCACELNNIFSKAFPENVFTIVLGRASAGEALIKNPNVAGVSFTGSVETGRHVYTLAAQYLKKCVLELGGSDPFIVLKDADLEAAIKAGVSSRFKNAGQSCTAAKRFIVEESISKKFIEGFVDKVKELKVGDPLDPSTEMGPMVNSEQLSKIQRQVELSVKAGAKILVGGKRLPMQGYYFMPTVLVNVKPIMPVWTEETFGPVAPIVIVKNEIEAINIANNTKFGLGAAIWSRNISKAKFLAEKVQTGNVAINGVVHSDPRMPFGGVKESGLGRELSRYGILEFVNIKSIKIYK